MSLAASSDEGLRLQETPFPRGWETALRPERQKASFRALAEFLEGEWARGKVQPGPEDLYRALALTPLSKVRVVIVGQEPYSGAGQSNGLAFSVRKGAPLPLSLQNLYRELKADQGVTPPSHGDLTAWAKRGVLLLNPVLTVREGQPGSHQGRGWEHFTDAVLKAVNARATSTVFVFWGRAAQRRVPLIDSTRHFVLVGPHPSPMAGSGNFLGSRPFTRINSFFTQRDQAPIDWSLPK